MVYLKENPIGIDIPVQKIQKYLADNLMLGDLEGYGRCFLIKKNEKTTPAFFVKNKDYEGILTDRKSPLKFFFIDDKETKLDKQQLKTEVDLIFMIDLNKVKKEIIHRADEEVRIEILKILQKYLGRVDIEIIKGIEALKGFNHGFIDMQPYHFLKFSFNLKYSINQC